MSFIKNLPSNIRLGLWAHYWHCKSSVMMMKIRLLCNLELAVNVESTAFSLSWKPVECGSVPTYIPCLHAPMHASCVSRPPAACAYRDSYEIILVSPRNYFLYTPLLPAVATGTCEERSIVEPVRNLITGKVRGESSDPSVITALSSCTPHLYMP